MKTEIEARLLECDVEKVVSALERNNATFVGDWLQQRYCYDFDPVRENMWIRLRTNGEKTTLTIKNVTSKEIDGTKESEVFVSEFEECDRILNEMGYYARSKQENRRIQYILDGVEVDIDFWPHIPTYVEFEGDSVEAIKNVCEKLNIDFEKLVSDDVNTIYNKYGYDVVTSPVLVLEEDRKKSEIKRK